MSLISLRSLKKHTPEPIRSGMKFVGFNRLLSLFSDKYKAELNFQTGWTEEFKANKSKVLEYWRKYRYFDKISEICRFNKNTKVLDVGCGISSILHFIEGDRLGIDPLADEYKKIYTYPEGIKVHKGYGEDIFAPHETYDVVFCSNTLDHVNNAQTTVNEIERVLKPRGYFILTVEIFRKWQKRDPAHSYCFTEKDINWLLKDKFEVKLEKLSEWIGLRAYADGSKTETTDRELIMILEKKPREFWYI